MSNGDVTQKPSGISISLSTKQGGLALLLFVGMIFGVDRVQGFWAGTPNDTRVAIEQQTQALGGALSTLNNKVDSLARVTADNKSHIETVELSLLARIDAKQDSIQDVVKLVGKNLEGLLRPLLESNTDTTQ